MRLTVCAAPLFRDRRGAAVVELALVLPVVLVMLFGIVSYGSWIALNHAVQQGANEAARAAIAGLTVSERVDLARTTARNALERGWRIPPADVGVSVDDDGASLTVAVRYDASANPLLALPFVPLPDRVIARRAAVRLTGL